MGRIPRSPSCRNAAGRSRLRGPGQRQGRSGPKRPAANFTAVAAEEPGVTRERPRKRWEIDTSMIVVPGTNVYLHHRHMFNWIDWPAALGLEAEIYLVVHSRGPRTGQGQVRERGRPHPCSCDPARTGEATFRRANPAPQTRAGWRRDTSGVAGGSSTTSATRH